MKHNNDNQLKNDDRGGADNMHGDGEMRTAEKV
jgi:hypothetical protein